MQDKFEFVFKVEEELDRREKAADNMIVLAKDRVGAELLFKEGVVQKIVRLMTQRSGCPW